MFKWLFHILIFATSSGKYQNKEKPLKRQRKLRLGPMLLLCSRAEGHMTPYSELDCKGHLITQKTVLLIYKK